VRSLALKEAPKMVSTRNRIHSKAAMSPLIAARATRELLKIRRIPALGREKNGILDRVSEIWRSVIIRKSAISAC
jgi:hypothetical protein